MPPETAPAAPPADDMSMVFYIIIGVLVLALIVVFVLGQNRAQKLSAKVEEEAAKLKKLTDALKQKNAVLVQQKNTLEEADKTVAEKAHQLEEQEKTISEQQEELVKLVRDVDLGQYVPVFVHEIKTPVQATKGALEYMFRLLPESYNLFHEFHGRFEPAEREVIWSNIEHLRNAPITLSSGEERAYRKKIESQLEKADLEDADEIAAKIVKIGLVDEKAIAQIIPLLKTNGKSELALNLLEKMGLIWKQANMMQHSTERIIDFLKVIQTYLHSGAGTATEKIETDLSENINLVLALLDYRIRHGIEVERHFDQTSKILAFPKELQQVWSNLIQNAIKAMNNVGKLTLTIRESGDNVEVLIQDNGPGIPPEYMARIFEAGFTTGKKGESTGMGLAIVRNIIESHKGDMTVTSKPGETIFKISLPKNQ